jgi:hypothetical protein
MTQPRSRARRVAGMVIPPVVLGLLIIGAWQLLVQGFHIKKYILPTPTQIFHAAWDDHELIRKSMVVTGMNSLIGLVIGAVLGVRRSDVHEPDQVRVGARWPRWKSQPERSRSWSSSPCCRIMFPARHRDAAAPHGDDRGLLHRVRQRHARAAPERTPRRPS